MLFTTEFTIKYTVCILYGMITNSQTIEGLVLIRHIVLTQLVFIGVTIETIHKKTKFTNNLHVEVLLLRSHTEISSALMYTAVLRVQSHNPPWQFVQCFHGSLLSCTHVHGRVYT